LRDFTHAPETGLPSYQLHIISVPPRLNPRDLVLESRVTNLEAALARVFNAIAVLAVLAAGLTPASLAQGEDPEFSKYGADFGLGAGIGVGSTGNVTSPVIGFSAGFDRNLNRHLGVQLEYNFNFFKVSNTYSNNYGLADISIHALTVNPYFNLNPRSKAGVYVIGGGGYFWRHSSFENPTGQESCGPFGCIPTASCSLGACWTNGAFGADVGAGFTRRIGDSRAKFFVEGRLEWAATPPRSVAAGANQPLPNYRTIYVPAQVGFRF